MEAENCDLSPPPTSPEGTSPTSDQIPPSALFDLKELFPSKTINYSKIKVIFQSFDTMGIYMYQNKEPYHFKQCKVGQNAPIEKNYVLLGDAIAVKSIAAVIPFLLDLVTVLVHGSDPNSGPPLAPPTLDSALAVAASVSDNANLHVPILPRLSDDISASQPENIVLDPDWQMFSSPRMQDNTNDFEPLDDAEFLDLIQSMTTYTAGNIPDVGSVLIPQPPEAPEVILGIENDFDGNNNISDDVDTAPDGSRGALNPSNQEIGKKRRHKKRKYRPPASEIPSPEPDPKRKKVSRLSTYVKFTASCCGRTYRSLKTASRHSCAHHGQPFTLQQTREMLESASEVTSFEELNDEYDTIMKDALLNQLDPSYLSSKVLYLLNRTKSPSLGGEHDHRCQDPIATIDKWESIISQQRTLTDFEQDQLYNLTCKALLALKFMESQVFSRFNLSIQLVFRILTLSSSVAYYLPTLTFPKLRADLQNGTGTLLTDLAVAQFVQRATRSRDDHLFVKDSLLVSDKRWESIFNNLHRSETPMAWSLTDIEERRKYWNTCAKEFLQLAPLTLPRDPFPTGFSVSVEATVRCILDLQSKFSKYPINGSRKVLLRLSADGRLVANTGQISIGMNTLGLDYAEQSAFNIFPLVIAIAKEDPSVYAELTKKLGEQLQALIQNKLQLSENVEIEFGFISVFDMKTIWTVLGLSYKNGQCFCPWCLCIKDLVHQLWSTQFDLPFRMWGMEMLSAQVFPCIMHLMCRVTEKLLKLLIVHRGDKKSTISRCKAMNDILRKYKIGLTFEGDDKTGVVRKKGQLRGDQINRLFDESVLQEVLSVGLKNADPKKPFVEALWADWEIIILYLRRMKVVLDESYHEAAKFRIQQFLHNFRNGCYRSDDMTPYLHVLESHVVDLQVYLAKNFDISLGIIAQQAFEATNKEDCLIENRATNHRGIESVEQLMLAHYRPATMLLKSQEITLSPRFLMRFYKFKNPCWVSCARSARSTQEENSNEQMADELVLSFPASYEIQITSAPPEVAPIEPAPLPSVELPRNSFVPIDAADMYGLEYDDMELDNIVGPGPNNYLQYNN